jgi:hypothetical protein
MNCDCNEKAVERVVKKEGPNQGKTFYTCLKNACKFFKFKDSPQGRGGNFKKQIKPAPLCPTHNAIW